MIRIISVEYVLNYSKFLHYAGVDYCKLKKLLEITSNKKIHSPFEIKGKGRTKLFSHFDIHYAFHAPPKYMPILQRYVLKE